ncbi:alkaline phosphatase D family protein [Streptomyces sp. NL15-2K]|uniref:alkaline phosphatase D family protein n=1 Tax=Streptomyces sp. NL15-2K TaxID=376149 RepID=UPI000F570623|nr:MULTISPECIES: alkaline phosphatase D family protein [Actinomycetes]WKX08703.1 alkaline phosphatase D family protein [Kutzneria buriramensis]GCB49812.1 phosphodiesterase/alkaline phosphatase D [Streptomyces sp. NL15-2K]
MAELRLGPLLRYADGSSATVWVETSRPCAAEVRCADGAGGESGTFQVEGHHYALVPVTGLTPGTTQPYEVFLDGTRVWPLPDSPFPDSVIRTPADGDPVRVAFGSCRWAAPPADGKDTVGPDALDTLAARIADDPGGERPDVLLLLGDQVYADETSDDTRRWLAARRDLSDPPGSEVADYEEYTRLYYESWLDPEVRWLLSTVPSCMIFDDHDVIDDWNTSAAWLADMRATDWWQERLLSGLMSYWVHQHLGNLSPDELAADPLYAAVRETPDGTDLLRTFAAEADADPASVRWSYRRDFGRVRLLMVDTRAARVLDEESRSMLNPGEARWLREQALDQPGSYDHLLIGTSLPWLLPHLVHDAEAWNAALCRGEKGARWARFGEDLRRRADLEHWAAFPASFDALAALLAEAGTGPDAPSTVLVLSGDVHHAYVAEPKWPAGPRSGSRSGSHSASGSPSGSRSGSHSASGSPSGSLSGPPDARVLQLTCSPVHNSIPLSIRLGFRFGWSAVARALGRRFAGHGGCPKPPIDWRRTGGPWFGNQLMTLTLRGRSARLRLDQAREVRDGKPRLVTVTESDLVP